LRAIWRIGLQALLTLMALLLIHLAVTITLSLAFGAENSLPTSIINMILVLEMTAAVLLSVWISGKILDKRTFVEFGLKLDKDWWVDFGFGMGLGGLLILMVFLLELVLGWVEIESYFAVLDSDLPFGQAIVLSLIFFIAVGFYEELLSRAYHLTNLAEGLAAIRIPASGAILLAAVLSSMVFSLLHILNPNTSVLSSINIFIAGLFLAAGYLLTGRLAIPVGLHISWNFFQGNVFGFPVSGGDTFAATIFKIQQSGPEIWTGGEFGPEGGLLGTMIQFIGLALILFYHKTRYNRTSLDLSLADSPSPAPSAGDEKDQS
jgi:membrane protease YdiL (CAAX protease family)